jgi:hypothetical protein
MLPRGRCQIRASQDHLPARKLQWDSFLHSSASGQIALGRPACGRARAAVRGTMNRSLARGSRAAVARGSRAVVARPAHRPPWFIHKKVTGPSPLPRVNLCAPRQSRACSPRGTEVATAFRQRAWWKKLDYRQATRNETTTGGFARLVLLRFESNDSRAVHATPSPAGEAFFMTHEHQRFAHARQRFARSEAA